MMEETFEGTFYFDNEKQDWCVKFTKLNKKEAVIKCKPEQISSNLPRKEGELIEVKFESDKRYYNEVLNVRLKSEVITETDMTEDYSKELEIQKSQEEKAAADRQPRLSGNFHNPYNFIPAIPRYEINKADEDGNISDLGDKPPIGHDRFYEGYFSGKLTVKMIVKTPLVVLDTARMSLSRDDSKHKEFPIRLDADGKPFINPTAIKGMLRSAYEAVTNSKMSFFGENEKLVFRMEADTKFIYPALIIKKGNNSQIKLLVDNRNKQQFAKLEMYDKVWNEIDNDKGKISKISKYTQNPKHYTDNGKQTVWVKCHWDNNSHSFIVDDIDNKKGANGNWKKGWIYISGANMKDKKYERVFLDYASNKTFSLGNLENDWEDLIANYQEIHEKEIEKRKPNNSSDYLGNDPGETSWSRHIDDKKSLKLEDGNLCYAFYRNGKIEALLPVMISRRMFPKAPLSLLPEELHPAESIDALSPADRVFGNIIQKSKEKKKTTAYRGQVRFGEVVLSGESANKPIDDIIQKFGQENNPDSWLPLNILGQPKPQQGRFYVAKNKGGDAQVDRLNNENAGYNLPLVKGLRGRKVYPHHAKLSVDYWTIQDGLREYLRPDGKQDSQNRSIQGWIQPETKFQFDIHFTNLSEVDLGALVWLLSLNQENENEYFHRFGGGKPYGFGSVKLELTGSDIRNGEALKIFYMSLDDESVGKFNEDEIKKLRDDFIELADSTFPTVIKSFLRACEGFSDKPTHYPRKTEELNADTKSFDWFVANSKIERLTVKHGYVLQNLTNDDGLPYLKEG